MIHFHVGPMTIGVPLPQDCRVESRMFERSGAMKFTPAATWSVIGAALSIARFTAPFTA
jgi:hypothetical protein